MTTSRSNALALPDMLMIRQQFEIPPALNLEAALEAEWKKLAPTLAIAPGARVAVGVGSRGIDNLARVTLGKKGASFGVCH